jgi:hypothetical protein
MVGGRIGLRQSVDYLLFLTFAKSYSSEEFQEGFAISLLLLTRNFEY